jgi:hypothetical protein
LKRGGMMAHPCTVVFKIEVRIPRTMKANMGLRSRALKRGGMMFLKRFR